MLTAAAKTRGWELPMTRIAEVWRAGCIIRSDMLTEMAQALHQDVGQNLVFSVPFTGHLKSGDAALRAMVVAATGAGIAVPALSAGLSWFDTMRSKRTTANIMQAQRNCFGRHGFARVDGKDEPHADWTGR